VGGQGRREGCRGVREGEAEREGDGRDTEKEPRRDEGKERE